MSATRYACPQKNAKKMSATRYVRKKMQREMSATRYGREVSSMVQPKWNATENDKVVCEKSWVNEIILSWRCLFLILKYKYV